MSNRPPFVYIDNFMTVVSWIGAIKLWCPMLGYTSCTQNFSDLQFDSGLLEIASLNLPMMTLSDWPAFPYLVESSKFHGFTDSRVQKSLKAFFAPLHPHHLLHFPMHINCDFTSDKSPDMFENIGINKWKDRGHIPLKRINGRILWDLVIFLCPSWIDKNCWLF